MRRESGMISLWAVVLTMFALLVSLAVSYYCLTERKMSAEYLVETRLRLAAESAVEHKARKIEDREPSKGFGPAEDNYDVAYEDDIYTCTVDVERAESGRLVITAVAYRDGSGKDWNRHKVVRGIVRENDSSYEWAGWAE